MAAKIQMNVYLYLYLYLYLYFHLYLHLYDETGGEREKGGARG